MTRICDLLGSRPEVTYECMYTKHKTQKRKIWHDGFVVLSDPRRLVVYACDEGKAGKVMDEIKLTAVDWESAKDEDYVETPKFLVEVINETPVVCMTSSNNGMNDNTLESSNTSQQSFGNNTAAGARSRVTSRGRDRVFYTKFCPTPLNPVPPRQIRHGRIGYPSIVNEHTTEDGSTVLPSTDTLSYDFARNPTSEWSYVSNAINRTPDEVLALLDK